MVADVAASVTMVEPSESALKFCYLHCSITKDKPAYNVEYFAIFCERNMMVSLVFLPHHDVDLMVKETYTRFY